MLCDMNVLLLNAFSIATASSKKSKKKKIFGRMLCDMNVFLLNVFSIATASS